LAGAVEAIRAVLLKEWAPIGVADEPMAQDEYDTYVPMIYRLIVQGVDVESLAVHLERIETEQMGLRSGGEHNWHVARRLIEVVAGLDQKP